MWNEKITILQIDKINPSQKIECQIDGDKFNKKIKLLCRIDTIKELEYFKAGGILQYVLNSIVKQTS